MNNSSSDTAQQLIGPDLILMLLFASGKAREQKNRLDGITRLEKLLFLVDQETSALQGVEDRFEFKPYDFGPYSKAVYEAVEVLEQAGLVQEERAYQGQSIDSQEEAEVMALDDREGLERRFWLTDNGTAVADLLSSTHPDVVRQLSEIKSSYGNMSLRQLIRYVYTKYPKWAEASKIRAQFS